MENQLRQGGISHINDQLCQILLLKLHPQTLKAMMRGKCVGNAASLASLTCRNAGFA